METQDFAPAETGPAPVLDAPQDFASEPVVGAPTEPFVPPVAAPASEPEMTLDQLPAHQFEAHEEAQAAFEEADAKFTEQAAALDGVHTIEHRSFGRESADEPMPSTVITGA